MNPFLVLIPHAPHRESKLNEIKKRKIHFGGANDGGAPKAPPGDVRLDWPKSLGILGAGARLQL